MRPTEVDVGLLKRLLQASQREMQAMRQLGASGLSLPAVVHEAAITLGDVIQEYRRDMDPGDNELKSDRIMLDGDDNLVGWFDHETGHFHTPPVGPKSDGCWNCDKASIRNGGLRLDDCVEKESDGKTITCKAWEPVKAKGRVYNHCDYSDMLHAAIMKALHELGVPGEGYPAPVANAVSILQAAAEAVEPPA